MLPAGFFGIPLGLLSLGLAWRLGYAKLGLPFQIGEGILTIAFIIWVTFIGLYLYKWVKAPQAASSELHHMIQGCFVSLIPTTTILVGCAIYPYASNVADIFIVLGIVAQIIFSAYRSAGMWKGNYDIDISTPILYLPTVATNFASAIALGMLGLTTIGFIFFGAGLFSWLSLEAAILLRLRRGSTLNYGIRPGLGIQLAPSFVGCSAYLANNGGQIDTLALCFIGYGILNFIFLLRLLPWILEKGFRIPLWGFSFGLASMVTVGMRTLIFTSDPSLVILAKGLIIVGTTLVGILLLGTLRFMMRNKFFPPVKG